MLKEKDIAVFNAIQREHKRQDSHIELIASENFVSNAVLEAQGSIMTNKYAEGYPGKRYYGGCQFVDEVEQLAKERICKLFGVKYANVQPHSGSQANMAAYQSVLEPGDLVLALSLSDGGHLTHGHHLNFSGKLYQFVSYGLNPETETIDYESLANQVKEFKPKAIVAGASAYPRIIYFDRMREIADSVGAYLIVDMAHIAGLVAAGLHPNPCEYAHIVTSTTHKTLRGPRGGLILTNDEAIAKKIDSCLFPGVQGGPLMHVIAAKAVAFLEALDPSFIAYQMQVIKNSQKLASELQIRGYRVVSGGTDNHMLLIDVLKAVGITGLQAEKCLDKVNITVNKNTIPNDTQKPFITSGLRLGTPAVTTRGMKEAEMVLIAEYIDTALKNHDNQETLQQIKEKVETLNAKFPLWYI